MTKSSRPPVGPVGGPVPVRTGRRLGGLLAPAAVIVVATGLLAMVTVGVLSLSHKLDRGRQAQIALAQISHLVDAVRYQPTFYLTPAGMADAEVAASIAYRQQLADAATTLSNLSALGRPVLRAALSLNRAAAAEVDALSSGQLARAKALDESTVTRAYAAFGSDLATPRPDGTAAPRGLLDTTSAKLDSEVATANRDVTRAMVGEIVGVGLLIITVTTIAGFLRRRRALRETQRAAERTASEHQAALLRNSSDLILVSDVDGVLSYASPASESMIGAPPEQLLGRPLQDLLHPADAHIFIDSLRHYQDGERDISVHELRLRHVDGSYRLVEIRFANLCHDPVVRGVVANVRDISERARLETELRHAQKLESVGQLASGIAHEINTPIQFIGDNVRFLGDAFGDLIRDPQETAGADRDYLTNEVPAAISQTLEGVDRVATIVRAMKAFGHPGSDEKARTDINEAVRNTLIVVNNTVKHTADVHTELGELPRVWCHPGDVNQVLVNLVVNAAHAISDKGDRQRGVITVRTYVDRADAVIEVHDTGCGIPNEVATRVFEPFFTTKEVGRGTGQGLSLAYALVTERHGGTIGFRARPGGGTIFTVRLPIAETDRVANDAETMAAERSA